MESILIDQFHTCLFGLQEYLLALLEKIEMMCLILHTCQTRPFHISRGEVKLLGETHILAVTTCCWSTP